MPILIGLGVGGLAGAAQYALVDQPKYQKQMALAAATQRYSPWTGLKASIPNQPNPLSDITQMGASGAGMAQSIGNAGLTKDNLAAQTDYFTKMAKLAQSQGYNPWQAAQGMPSQGGAGGFNYDPGSMSPSSFNSSVGTIGG